MKFDKAYAIKIPVSERSPFSFIYHNYITEKCDKEKTIASEMIGVLYTIDSETNIVKEDTIRVISICEMNEDIVKWNLSTGILVNIKNIDEVKETVFIKKSEYTGRKMKTIYAKILPEIED